MRRRWILITLALAACSLPKSKDETRQVNDSAAVASHVPELSNSEYYVGYVGKFNDNNTFSTGLFFAKGFDKHKFETVKKMGHDVVFEDEYTRRVMVPLDKAAKFFNMTGLKAVNIYNNEGELMAKGKLIRMEFFDDAADGSFVAVYEADNQDVTDFSYCISASMKGVGKSLCIGFQDDALTTSVARYLQIKKEQVDVVNHYRFESGNRFESGTIYTAISADTTAYIIESTKEKRTTLYKSERREAINALTIIGKELGGRPILLANCSDPDKDEISYSSVLTFIGSQYKRSADHRVRF